MNTPTHPWRTPLAIIIASCAIITLSMGVRQTGGIFMQPMTLAHGWSRELYSFAIALQNLVWGLSSPFSGALADRFGAGRTLVLGAVIYVLGLVLMTFSATGVEFNLSAGLLVGLGLSATTYSVIMGVVGRNTPPEKRSMALGIVGAGGSFGQFATLPAGQALISGLGWQAALWILAGSIALIIPLAWHMAGNSGKTEGHQQSILEALKEAGRHPSFHFLFWSYLVCGFHTAFIMLHLPAYLVDSGFSANLGMMAVALIALFNIFGSFFFGWVGGRASKSRGLAWLYGLRSLAILLFVLVPLSKVSILLFAAVMGFLWLGTVPLTNGLVAQIFGVRYMSMLTGIIFLGHQIGSFAGAWMGGVIYDKTGSYLAAWSVAIGLGLVAALLSLPIRDKALVRAQPAAA